MLFQPEKNSEIIRRPHCGQLAVGRALTCRRWAGLRFSHSLRKRPARHGRAITPDIGMCTRATSPRPLVYSSNKKYHRHQNSNQSLRSMYRCSYALWSHVPMSLRTKWSHASGTYGSIYLWSHVCSFVPMIVWAFDPPGLWFYAPMVL